MSATTMRDVLAWREDGRGLTPERWLTLPVRERASIERECFAWLRRDFQRHQLVYYQPANPDARPLHLSLAREVGIQGGRKSSKTGTMLAEAAIQMTGIVPESLEVDYPREKIKGYPIRVRFVVTSLVSSWDTNLKLKLQWFVWNGRLSPHKLPGDPRLGHWGWIPPDWLVNGDWEQSWDERHRTLRLQHPTTREPWSTLQVMSHDQDIQDFHQGAFDLIVEDEIPPEEIHQANKLRAMELGGQILTAGTPRGDRSAAVTAAWYFDQIIVPGLEGVNRAEVEAFVIWTEHNRTLAAKDIAFISKGLTEEQRRVQLHGETLHLSGLILSGFREKRTSWCFRCRARAHRRDGGACEACGGADLIEYRHVWDDEDLPWPGPAWPVVFYMDPHQARPTACAWFKVDPQDGWWQIAEAEIPGDAATVRRTCEGLEAEHGWTVVWRKGDPKITAQANQFAREVNGEPFNIRRAFEEAGFPFEEANTNFTVAVARLEDALAPHALTRAPRLRVHASCTRTIYQVGHFTWDTRGRRENVDLKEQPSRRHSDFPALWRYLAMDEPDRRMLDHLLRPAPVSVIHAGGTRNVNGW